MIIARRSRGGNWGYVPVCPSGPDPTAPAKKPCSQLMAEGSFTPCYTTPLNSLLWFSASPLLQECRSMVMGHKARKRMNALTCPSLKVSGSWTIKCQLVRTGGQFPLCFSAYELPSTRSKEGIKDGERCDIISNTILIIFCLQPSWHIC